MFFTVPVLAGSSPSAQEESTFAIQKTQQGIGGAPVESDHRSLMRKHNKKQAQEIERLRKEAEQGDAEAQYLLGMMYIIGTAGVAQDKKQGMEWVQKAAEQGDTNAQMQLENIYESGRNVEQKQTHAVERIREGAERGIAFEQSTLGRLYFTGSAGVAQDKKQGMQWLQKAAEQGDIEAQSMLAEIYERGDSEVKQDWKQAYYWHSRITVKKPWPKYTERHDAAEKHLSPEERTEVKLLVSKSLHKAAEQGDGSAQSTLARLYEKSDGEYVKQDWQQAYYWYSLVALASPYPPTRSFLKRRSMVADRLSPEQLAEVERLIGQSKTKMKVGKDIIDRNGMTDFITKSDTGKMPHKMQIVRLVSLGMVETAGDKNAVTEMKVRGTGYAQINGGAGAFFWNGSPQDLVIRLSASPSEILGRCDDLIRSGKPVEIKAYGSFESGFRTGAQPSKPSVFLLENVEGCQNF